MDGNNQKKAENLRYGSKIKKKQNSKEKMQVKFLEDKGHINKHHPNTSEVRFSPNDLNIKLEKAGTKQRENIPEEKARNDAVATNHKKNNGKTLERIENFNVTKIHDQNKKKSKRLFNREKDKETLFETERHELLDELSGETFEFEDIMNNSRILELIEGLVGCFTTNSTLPKNELQTLKLSLYERTCYVFLDLLNSCVKKAFTRVLNSDFVQDFKNKNVSKKDASCQTIFIDISDKEGSKLQKNVCL